MTIEERIAQEYIWEDMDSFLAYIQQNTPDLTATFKMKGSDCAKINELLHYKKTKFTTRSKHNQHYLLWVFYKVALSLKIVKVVPKGRKNMLAIDEVFFDLWQNFDPTDKYFTFIEGLFCYTDISRLSDNERAYGIATGVDRLVTNILKRHQTKDNKSKITQKDALLKIGLWGTSFSSMVKIFACLGWIDVKYTEADRYSFEVQRMEILPLGESILPILATTRLVKAWNDFAYQFEEYKKENVAFLNLFNVEEQDEAEAEAEVALLLKVLPLREKEGFLDAFEELMDEKTAIQHLPTDKVRGLSGTYRFKAIVDAQPAMNCHISIGSQFVLEDLHLAILKGFDLNNNHLYSFYLSEWASYDYRIDGQPRYSLETDELKYLENEVKSVYNVKLSQLRLAQGDVLRYEFDYSATFRVILILEEVQIEGDSNSEFIVEKKKATRSRKKK